MSGNKTQDPPSTASDLYIRGGATDETATPPRGELSLVSNFRPENYIYSFTNDLDNPHDSSERATVMNGFRAAASLAGVKDYKLLEEHNKAVIYLRSPLDVHRFKIATLSTDQVEHEFFQAEQDYDFRKLKRAGTQLQRLSDQAGFGDSILFGVIRSNRSIMLLASTKKAYLDFDNYVAANKDKFQKFFDLQRKEPEFDIPMPDVDEAVLPKITVYDKNPMPEQQPESELFIRGGASDETATAPTGKLRLAKSFSQENYPFALRPSVAINPDACQMDRLCIDLPDYAQWKLETKNADITRRIHGAMAKADVDDYCLYEDDGRVHAHFKDPKDLAVAYASIMPDMQYQIDYLHCSENASPLKLSRKVKRLREIFEKSGNNIHVRFVADKERRVIQAITDTAEDFARVQGLSRHLEKTSPAFRMLVGL